ncbi:MAG: hypothetical protein ACLFVO_15155, partial [Chloroflexaceae bacterium]
MRIRNSHGTMVDRISVARINRFLEGITRVTDVYAVKQLDSTSYRIHMSGARVAVYHTRRIAAHRRSIWYTVGSGHGYA